jgi:transposase
VIIAIDPGPRASGVVVYDKGMVALATKAATLDQVRDCIEDWGPGATVVCERTQAGPPSTQVVLTTEVVGRIQEMCHHYDVDLHLYYRRQVLQALCCARTGNKDSLVRMACIEMHGGDKATAIGKKYKPGPLYGVSSHAWQALGLACAHIILTAQEQDT